MKKSQLPLGASTILYLSLFTLVRVAKFYLYHRTKIAKARPGFDDQPEYPSAQINSSSPCISSLSAFMSKVYFTGGLLHFNCFLSISICSVHLE